MAVKIVLFRKSSSIISKCISLVTSSNITHSAVFFDGEIWDSSEKRGKFGKADVKKLQNRTVEVYHLGANDDQANLWLIKMNGKRYDYLGIIQWGFFYLAGRFFEKYRLNSKNKVYCFEATGAIITRVIKRKFPVNVTGENLRRTLGKPEFIGELKEYIN